MAASLRPAGMNPSIDPIMIGSSWHARGSRGGDGANGGDAREIAGARGAGDRVARLPLERLGLAGARDAERVAETFAVVGAGLARRLVAGAGPRRGIAVV